MSDPDARLHMAATRLKQLLMGIGLLTVLGVLAAVGLVAYLWWDAETTAAEIEAEAEFDSEDGLEFETEFEEEESDTDAEVTE